jgi:hypothetical protein
MINVVHTVADLHGATRLHWIPVRKKFLCKTLDFHHMCTPKNVVFAYFGTGRHPVAIFSSSATKYIANAYSRNDIKLIHDITTSR